MSDQNKDNDLAFVVGNGVSRKPIDLSKLKNKGTIYGCNALYRDFDDYDYLVAIDEKIVKELQEKANDERLIIPPEEERWESPDYSLRQRRSNAGMNAMLEAIRGGHKRLFCIGFDFLIRGNISTDNIYKDTNCYEPETHTVESDNLNRVRYLNWFMNRMEHVRFTFVLPDNQRYHQLNAPNVTGIKIENFIKKVVDI